MYVAITRAKKAAMLSFSELRRVWGKTENTSPSRFLKEIDSEWLDANFDIEELSGRNRWERVVEESRPKFESIKSRYNNNPRGAQQSAVPQRPRADIISTPKPLDPARSGMRSLGARQAESGVAFAGACDYHVGERVAHPKFGAGTIERIEPLTTDHKVVVLFDSYGSKTLLAKFAKLTKL